MPIRIRISPLDHMIIGETEGEVTLADLLGYFDSVTAARALHFRKIFDSTNGTSVLSDDDVAVLKTRMQAFVELGKVGPFAVVAGSQRHGRLAAICQTVASADRPMRVFRDIRSARLWLDNQPLGR